MKIRDTYAAGVVAGVIGSLPALALDVILVQAGLSRYYGPQLTGSIFLFPGLTDWPAGLLLGIVVWFGVGALLGIVISFLMAKTGKDYWALKGMSVALILVYTAMYGFLFTLRGARIVPFGLATNLSQLAENLITGVTVAYLAVRWSHNSLEES